MIKLNSVNKRSAFTLVEVLIALSISSFIIFGMIQLYRNIVRFMDNSREQMILNRTSCLLIDQVQKDISSSFIPKLSGKIVPKKTTTENDKQLEAQKVEKKSTETRDDQKDKKYFVGEIYDGEYRRIEGKKWELFKSINFISTNPLQVYGERRPRLVRIKYELLKDKQKSLRDKLSYKLIRKETYDLDNYDFKEPEELRAKEKKYIIRIFTLAENIKELYFEYVSIKPTEEKTNRDSRIKEEDEIIRSFIWDLDFVKKNFVKKIDDKKDDEQVDYVVPQKIDFNIVFWDDLLERQFSFQGSIPIFSYPTLKEEVSSKPTQENKEPENKQEPIEAQKTVPPEAQIKPKNVIPVKRGER